MNTFKYFINKNINLKYSKAYYNNGIRFNKNCGFKQLFYDFDSNRREEHQRC